MANDITNFIPELWSARIQKLREKMLVAKAICNFEEQAGLSFGDRVHRPTAPDFVVNDYVRNTDVTLQDVTTGDDYMDIDRSKEVSFYIDKLDAKQSKYDVEMESVKRATYQIKNEMDGYVLRQVINATYSADAAQNGGSAGTPATLAPSTTVQFFENAKAILRTANVEDDRPWYAVVTPKVVSVIAQTFVGAGFNLADSALKNGYKGDAFGLKIYESTNVLHSQTATCVSVVEDNTLTVAGVTFTAKNSPSAAGTVDVGADDTTMAANFAAAINGGAGAGTAYVDITAANRNKLKAAGIRASSALGVLTVYGSGEFVMSKVGAPITLGTLTANCEIGRMGSTDLVVQMNPEVQKNKDPKKSGYNWLIIDIYGSKKFTEGANRSLNAKIVA